MLFSLIRLSAENSPDEFQIKSAFLKFRDIKSICAPLVLMHIIVAESLKFGPHVNADRVVLHITAVTYFQIDAEVFLIPRSELSSDVLYRPCHVTADYLQAEPSVKLAANGLAKGSLTRVSRFHLFLQISS